MEFCLHFFFFFCGWNSKTLKCSKILHFQKHSSLCNRIWKRTMFFIFSFFHFLCKFRISTTPLSVNKNEIFRNLQQLSFINLGHIKLIFVLECKSCKILLRSTFFTDFFDTIIQFYLDSYLYFDPRWNKKCWLRRLAVLCHWRRFTENFYKFLFCHWQVVGRNYKFA